MTNQQMEAILRQIEERKEATIRSIKAVTVAKVAKIHADADKKVKDLADECETLDDLIAKSKSINDQRWEDIDAAWISERAAIAEAETKASEEEASKLHRESSKKRWYQNEALQATAAVVGGFTLLMFGTMVGTGAGVAVSRKVFGVDLAQQPVNLVYDHEPTPAELGATPAAS